MPRRCWVDECGSLLCVFSLTRYAMNFGLLCVLLIVASDIYFSLYANLLALDMVRVLNARDVLRIVL